MATLKSRNEVAVKLGCKDWDALGANSKQRNIALAWANSIDEEKGRTEEDERDREMLDFYYEQYPGDYVAETPMDDSDKTLLAALKAVIAKYGAKNSLEKGRIYVVMDYRINPHITAGKHYEVLKVDGERFKIQNDSGLTEWYFWRSDVRIGSHNWVRVTPQGGEA